MIYLVSNQLFCFDDSLFKVISVEESIVLLTSLKEIALDTETEGLDNYNNKLLLLQLGNDEFQIVYDLTSFDHKIPQLLKDYLNNSSQLFVFQNAKFDLKFLFYQGVLIRKLYDTMLAEIILTNGLQYSGRDLATLAWKYGEIRLDKSVRNAILTGVLNNAVLEYGAKDIQVLPIIKKKQLEKAAEFNLLKAIDLDNAFVIVLAYVEYCGIKLDYPRWLRKTRRNQEEAHTLKIELERQLWEDKKYKFFSGMQDMFTGEQECLINWDSPKQVLALFKNYNIKTTLKIKGVNKESIDAKVLTSQEKQFKILPPYLKYKAKQKEISTYGESWKKYINPVTGRIHTTFQQLMDTGRLSCGNKRDGTPNLQNIPNETETRSCFIPEEGNSMIDADYSGQEQVIMANFTGEPNLINFYAKGFDDMHSYIAFLMYENIRRCSVEELTPDKLKYVKTEYPDKRYLAKIAGFSINYGGNGSTIAKNCNIPLKDGEFVYKSYFEAFPKMRNYFDLVFNKAAYYTYIEFNNVTKRKYFFDVEKNDYFALREIVEDPYFWHTTPNAKELFGSYNKAKGDISRIAQNYPIQGGENVPCLNSVNSVNPEMGIPSRAA